MNASPPPDYRTYVPRLLASWPDTNRHRQVPGTLVFVDVSGFTAMSERLARKGRIGAEEVARVLTTVFTELLDKATARGADLLKFGGDALLLLFSGDDHCLRGAAAAYEMRAALRRVGRINTPAGRVVLGMSVGVHTGVFDTFVVGASHRELIVSGPAASKTVEMEGTAEAGEIALSPEAAAAVGDDCIGDPKGNGWLLIAAPPAPEHAKVGWTGTGDLVDFVPPALRAAVGSVQGEGEHRRVTVAFLKFTGLDAMVSTAGPDAVADHLEGIVTSAQQAVEDFGVSFIGSDIDADGGKLILAAGAPIAHEDDDDRMLRAVLDISGSEVGRHLKIGVNRGPLFSGDVGASFRRTYTLIGDGMNLAARVMSQAEKGEILATGTVLAGARDRYRTEDIPPFRVKGKSEPVTAVRVLAHTGVGAAGTGDLDLVGRGEELAALIGLMPEPGAPARVAELVGPRGIGKSRLVDEIMHTTPDVVWHEADADRFQISAPYSTFRSILEDLIDFGDGDSHARGRRLTELVADRVPELEKWVPLIATVAGADAGVTSEVEQLDEAFRKGKLHEVITDLLVAVAGRPTVFLYKDAQWMDVASWELLEYIVAAAPEQPWLHLVVRRPGDQQFELVATESIELGPLDDESSGDLVTQAIGRPLLPHQLKPLVEQSNGNPLFLLELARSFAATGELPDSVEAAVTSRIDRLAPVERRILRFGSAIGRTFDTELLDAVLEDDLRHQQEGIWDRLAEFLEEDRPGVMRFRQPIVQEVAYTGLPFRVRRSLHQQLGDAVEQRSKERDDAASVLAFHFEQAGDLAKAWKYAVAAGDEARDSYGLAEATEQYRRALRAASKLADVHPSDVADVAERLGDVSEIAGDFDTADDAWHRARNLSSGQPVAIARLLRKQGLLREKAGSYPAALRWFGRGLKQLDNSGADDPQTRAELCIAYAGVRFRQGRYRECVEWSRRALEAGGTPVAEGHAYYLMGLAHRRMGSDEGRDYPERALQIFEKTGDLVRQGNVLNNMGNDAYYNGTWSEAARYFERSRDVRERAGDVIGAGTTANNVGFILCDLGRLDEAERALQRAERLWHAANYPSGRAAAISNLGRLRALQGRHDEARELLTGAHDEMQRLGASAWAMEASTRVVENDVLAGRNEDAAKLADDLLQDKGSAPHAPALYRYLGHARYQSDDKEGAIRSWQRSRAAARDGASYYDEALALLLLSAMGEAGEDDTALARSTLQRLGVTSIPEFRLMPDANL